MALLHVEVGLKNGAAELIWSEIFGKIER